MTFAKIILKIQESKDNGSFYVLKLNYFDVFFNMNPWVMLPFFLQHFKVAKLHLILIVFLSDSHLKLSLCTFFSSQNAHNLMFVKTDVSFDVLRFFCRLATRKSSEEPQGSLRKRGQKKPLISSFNRIEMPFNLKNNKVVKPSSKV